MTRDQELLLKVAALATRREEGYRNREHGDLLNKRIADELVRLVQEEVQPHLDASQVDEDPQMTDDLDGDGWIKREAEECPVPADTRVYYIMRDEEGRYPDTRYFDGKRGVPAGHLRWTETGRGSDIIAYRIVGEG